MDNIVILNETIEEAKAKRRGCISYKIDFAKAHDSVDWEYLRIVMRRFNFNEKWIMCIMESISSARASVLINGSLRNKFKLEKGLRQGDPFSPFLSFLPWRALA